MSLIGKGIASMRMPVAVAASARRGFTKYADPMNAKVNPAIDPSIFLLLFIGIGVLPNNLPKIEAALSPRVTIAIET